jgi:hypothetical protein
MALIDYGGLHHAAPFQAIREPHAVLESMIAPKGGTARVFDLASARLPPTATRVAGAESQGLRRRNHE